MLKIDVLLITAMEIINNPFNKNIRQQSSSGKRKKYKGIVGSIVFLAAFFYFFIIAINTPFTPSSMLITALWKVSYPLLCILFFYLVYLKKDGRFSIKKLKFRARQHGENRVMVKCMGGFFVFFVPALLVFLALLVCTLLSNYFANEKVSQTVTVTSVDCDGSYGSSSLDLGITSRELASQTISFSYGLCEQYPHIYRLKGQQIELNERKWFLGTVYDGFYYSENLNLS